MTFDEFTVVLLTSAPDPPPRTDAENGAIQDAHMSHLADLHQRGDMLAAGPLSDGHYRGMLVLRTSAEQAAEVMAADPAVLAGWFEVTVLAWRVPSGALHYAATTFPRSLAELD